VTIRLVQGSFDKPPDRLDQDAGKLFDFAVVHRDGFTHLEAELTFAWTGAHFREVERRLREVMASESENLVCNPNEDDPGGPWLYRLTADIELTSLWHENRLGDSETRLKSIMFVAQSAMHAHSGRTTTGKRARILYKAASRALEDLEELREASA